MLRDIQPSIAAGAHVAIVGASGAGKSSLVGLLLGWHRAVFGKRAGRRRTSWTPRQWIKLRPHIAWVDPGGATLEPPARQKIWRYGLAAEPRMPVDEAIDAAGLRRVLERLPDGAATALGEGGGLVSGGEGQRVRLGRALLRPGVRLAILDEAVPRPRSRTSAAQLLQRARELWRDATLLSISHDITEALTFERVLVMEEGRIVEDGNPRQLSRRS